MKLDFEKTFDKLEHEIIIQVLKTRALARNGSHGFRISISIY